MKRRAITLFLAAALAVSVTGCSHSSSSTTTFTTSVTNDGETTTHTTTTTVEDGNKSTEETTEVTEADDDFDDIDDDSDDIENDSDDRNIGDANGVSVNESGEFVSDADTTDLRDTWHEIFYYGAEGVTKAGDTILFAYDNPEIEYGAMMVINSDNYLTAYDFGPVEDEGNYYQIEDVDGENELPFSVTASEDDHMTLVFQDGDETDLFYVDQDTIIDDMVSVVEAMNAQNT